MANILPFAPLELYPQLQNELNQQPDFRMQKVYNETSASLNKEVTIKRLRKNINVPRRLSTGVLLALVFFQRRFQALVAAPPSCHNPTSRRRWKFRSRFVRADIISSKKLNLRIKKHQEIATLAIAKRDTIDRMLSKALADNQISDSEFQLIMTEFSRYNVLKDAVWQSSRPEAEK